MFHLLDAHSLNLLRSVGGSEWSIFNMKYEKLDNNYLYNSFISVIGDIDSLSPQSERNS